MKKTLVLAVAAFAIVLGSCSIGEEEHEVAVRNECGFFIEVSVSDNLLFEPAYRKLAHGNVTVFNGLNNGLDYIYVRALPGGDGPIMAQVNRQRIERFAYSDNIWNIRWDAGRAKFETK